MHAITNRVLETNRLEITEQNDSSSCSNGSDEGSEQESEEEEENRKKLSMALPPGQTRTPSGKEENRINGQNVKVSGDRTDFTFSKDNATEFDKQQRTKSTRNNVQQLVGGVTRLVSNIFQQQNAQEANDIQMEQGARLHEKVFVLNEHSQSNLLP